jgi:ATP-dependent DNA helicase PIF1
LIVKIPEDILVKVVTNPIGDIVDAIYLDLLKNMFATNFFQDRAILAPTLDVVEQINDYVLSLIPGEFKEYLSCDSVSRCDQDDVIDHQWITTEFLNEIRCSGLPNYRLIIKVGVPIMLLRNLDVSTGLCNGTRLTVTYLGTNVIGAKIVTGSNIGDVVYIPRMKLLPSDAYVSIGDNFHSVFVLPCLLIKAKVRLLDMLVCIYLGQFLHMVSFMLLSRACSN